MNINLKLKRYGKIGTVPQVGVWKNRDCPAGRGLPKVGTVPIFLLLTVLFLLAHSTLCVNTAIARSTYDNDDRNSDYNQSGKYAPGWMNSVLNTQEKSRMLEDSQKLNDVENRSLLQHASAKKDNDSDTQQVTLQKKKSGSGANKTISHNITVTHPDDTLGSFKIGDGTDWLDRQGNATTKIDDMCSEVVNGKRVLYAWRYDDSGTTQAIQDAVNYFNEHNLTGGGAVLIKEGSYGDAPNDDYATGYVPYINLLSNVSLYGGYDGEGNRDFGETTIHGGFYLDGLNNVNIDGFDFGNTGNDSVHITTGSNITIENNTFHSSAQSIAADQATALVIKNNTFGDINNPYLSPYAFLGIEGDSNSSSDVIFENNVVVRSSLFIGFNVTAHVYNNIFNYYAYFYAYYAGSFIDSKNNNYIGSFYLYGESMSSNYDYFGGTRNTSYADSFSMPTKKDSVNSDAGLKSIDQTDNPLYFTQAPGQPKETTTTIESSVFIFNPYNTGKLSYDNYLSSVSFNTPKDKSEGSILSEAFSQEMDRFASLPLGGGFAMTKDVTNSRGGLNLPYQDENKYNLFLKGMIPNPIDHTIEDTILSLESKSSRTAMEDNLLEAAKLLEENAQNMDEEAIKEFNQVVTIVEMAEDMKDLMRPEDLDVISRSLQRLVEEQHALYNDYLKTTQKLYEKLSALLGVEVSEESIPDSYKPIFLINAVAKKKIAVDLTIERLKAKDEITLKDNEKEALKAYADILTPMKEEYLGRLKMTMSSFMVDINEVFKNEEPAFISRNGSSVKAVLLLGRINNADKAQP